jgi:hypothetical protein
MASSRRARGRGGAPTTAARAPRGGAAGEHAEHTLVEASIHCAPARAHLLVVPTAGAARAGTRTRRRR